ncbi:MAG: HIT domain-containing protein [Actinomycetota bacterium]|nr:HIT domain-containing protein [Actinomycetota bacterium]MDP2289487.1 HIT domain-containing protein [Actinomycetota bacterium]
MSECLFCRIIAGELPCEVVMRNDDVIAIRDIAPQAPTHVLVIPIRHFTNLQELSAQAPELLPALVDAAAAVAAEAGLSDAYRLVFNTGEAVGQSVLHVHAHVLGGREFTWPPG